MSAHVYTLLAFRSADSLTRSLTFIDDFLSVERGHGAGLRGSHFERLFIRFPFCPVLAENILELFILQRRGKMRSRQHLE